ncbi:hypothetical protein GEMRC1_009260 [Eukaryota sp. GEM-RC1]
MFLCAICKINEIGCSLLCGHCFCPSCLAGWIETNNFCPVCRTPADRSHIRKVFLPSEESQEAIEAPTIDITSSPRFLIQQQRDWIPLPRHVSKQLLDSYTNGQPSLSIDPWFYDLIMLKRTHTMSYSQQLLKVGYDYPSNIDWLFSVRSGFELCLFDMAVELEKHYSEGTESFELETGMFKYKITFNFGNRQSLSRKFRYW